MESSQTPTENPDKNDQKNEPENENEQVNVAKIEAMVTPEQVLSANVARKRRTITRKRSADAHKIRSQTPIRQARFGDDDLSSSDEKPPKTPERKRRFNGQNQTSTFNDKIDPKVLKNTKESFKKDTEINNIEKPLNGSLLELHNKNEELPNNNKEEPNDIKEVPNVNNVPNDNNEVPNNNKEVTFNNQDLIINKIEETHKQPYPKRPTKLKKQPGSSSTSSPTLERKNTIPEQINKIVATNKKDFLNLFEKTKTTLEEKGRDFTKRTFKKPDVKRSQSSPKQLTESEVLESFRRAQVATAEREQARNRSESARRYSTGSDKSVSPEPQRPARKPYRPIVEEFVKQKRAQKQQQKPQFKANKIIEILDPKTSKVIAVKDIGNVAHMKFVDMFQILRFYSVMEVWKEYRKYKSDMSEEYKIIRRLRRKCVNHLIILMIFCGFGGLIFKFTEGTFENFYKCGVKRVKRDFVDLLWTKSHNLREDEWKSMARNKLRNFEEELHTAHEAGVHSYSGQRSWSFLNGIVYCLTIVTTIGYGHLYPTTTTGQALTIVYSLIGIPLFLIILTDFGKLFTRCIKFLWSFVRRLYYTGSCRRYRKTAHAKEIWKGAQMMYDLATFRRPSMFDPNANQSPQESHDGNTTAPPTPAISNFEIDDEFNLPISLAILLLVLYIFLGAVLFGIWEGWDFFASFYFVFISMSTIGFGDYVPRHPIFMIVSIVYLVFGLALMSMCINVVQVKLSDTFNQASAKIGATIGLGVAEEDGSIKTVPPKPVEMPLVHGNLSDINLADKDVPNTSKT